MYLEKYCQKDWDVLRNVIESNLNSQKLYI